MVQLILNNSIYLPEVSRDKYSCYPEPLGVQIDMISGRRVEEIRGNVIKISYSCDFIGNELMREVLALLRSGQSFPVAYLPDGSNEMASGIFLRESLTNPTFAFSRHGLPYWHNFSFTLREVKPHD